MKIFICLFWGLFICQLHAQTTELPTRELIFTTSDTLTRVRVLVDRVEWRAKKTRTYTWYQPDTISSSMGGWSGHLLHGTYQVFYPNKQLYHLGAFKMGEKEGLWKEWYPDGMRKSEKIWRHGRQHGAALYYNPEGMLIRKEKRAKGQLHGVVRIYKDGQLTEKLRYKKGQSVEKASSKDKKRPVDLKEHPNAPSARPS